MMSTSRRSLAAAVLGFAAILLVAGCSTGPQSGPAAAPSGSSAAPASATPTAHAPADACTIVTEQDASAALGSDPGPGVPDAQSGVTACTYGTAPSMVSVHVSPAGKAEFDQMHGQPIEGTTAVDLSGIGDAAFGAFKDPVAAIAFYRGSSYVSIVIYADGSQDRAVALATAAADRL
jgi:hypothetical protein